MTSFAHHFSRNIRLRIWYIFITTTPKKVCFIAKVELPSVSIGIPREHVQTADVK